MDAKFTALIVLLLVGRVTPQLLGPVQGLVNTAANIISYINENYGPDGYKFMYATDDQTVREEKGEFVNGIWTVTGFVKWLSPDKKTEHTVKYKADDKGYHAEQESRIAPGHSVLPSLTPLSPPTSVASPPSAMIDGRFRTDILINKHRIGPGVIAALGG